jgi:hypothetical protein
MNPAAGDLMHSDGQLIADVIYSGATTQRERSALEPEDRYTGRAIWRPKMTADYRSPLSAAATVALVRLLTNRADDWAVSPVR